MNDRPTERRHVHRTRAQERIDALETPSATQLLAQLEELRASLAAAQQEAGDNRAGWQRAAADFANFKRRTEQEREATLGLANEILLLKVLAVADDFDRAMAAAMAPRILSRSRPGRTAGFVAVARSTSAVVTAPPGPLPCRPARSIPRSRATLRAAGDMRA